MFNDEKPADDKKAAAEARAQRNQAIKARDEDELGNRGGSKSLGDGLLAPADNPYVDTFATWDEETKKRADEEEKDQEEEKAKPIAEIDKAKPKRDSYDHQPLASKEEVDLWNKRLQELHRENEGSNFPTPSKKPTPPEKQDDTKQLFNVAKGITVKRLPPAVISPTKSGELRSKDGWGVGQYGASRDNGKRPHKGLDFTAVPGQKIDAPVSGTVINVKAPVYTGQRTKQNSKKALNPNEPTYFSVDIKTPDGYVVRSFYVDATVKVGDQVKAGETKIGHLQDLGQRYPGITNHVHVEIRDPRVIAYPDAKSYLNKRLDIDPNTGLLKRP